MYNFIKKEKGILIYSVNDISNPLKQIDEIEKEIKNFENISGIVIDILLCRGNNSGRFIYADVRKNKIVRNTLKKVDVSKRDALRKICCDFYKENIPEQVEHSILTSVQKNDFKRDSNLIKKGE